MRKTIIAIMTLGGLSLTGCASAVKLENVAGTWSCPRVDGVCADIATLDRRIIGGPVDVFQPGQQPSSQDGSYIPVNAEEGGTVLPARTADQVARIVIAPSVDRAGHYHGARAIYAVMRPGYWIERSNPLDDPTPTVLQMERDAGDSQRAERSATQIIRRSVVQSAGASTAAMTAGAARLSPSTVETPTPSLKIAADDE